MAGDRGCIRENGKDVHIPADVLRDLLDAQIVYLCGYCSSVYNGLYQVYHVTSVVGAVAVGRTWAEGE